MKNYSSGLLNVFKIYKFCIFVSYDINGLYRLLEFCRNIQNCMKIVLMLLLQYVFRLLL